MKFLKGPLAALVLSILLFFPIRLDAAACGVSQLLTNADLDLGSGMGWVEDGAGFPIILSRTDPADPLPVTPHSGEFAGWMGRVDSATRALYQDVLVPADAAELTVSGYRLITTEETSGVWDIFIASLRNDANEMLESLGTLSNADADLNWLGFNYVVVGDYAGQVIRIHFENTNDAANNTNFFLDSLAVNAVVCDPFIFANGFENPADCVGNVCPTSYVTGSTRNDLNASRYFFGTEFINAPDQVAGASLTSITAFLDIPAGVQCTVDFYVWQSSGQVVLEWSGSTNVSGPVSKAMSDSVELFLSSGFEYTVGYGVVCSGGIRLYYGDVPADPTNVLYDSGSGLLYQTSYFDSAYSGFSPIYDGTQATSNSSFIPHVSYRIRPD